MALNYEQRLQNLRNRRFDNEINESRLTKSFNLSEIPKNIKYLMESMTKIDKEYNDKTIDAAKKVQSHLEGKLNLHFQRDYWMQGSVMTSTNIIIHSDIDLLTIIGRYHFPGPGVPNQYPYNESDPNSDIKELRRQSEKIMEMIYDEVDKSGKKGITIFNKSLKRKVDLVFCFWYYSKEYHETKNDYYKGLYLFDFTKDQKELDYPFAHMREVNFKGDATNDGSRMGIRLLKTLKADSIEKIGLTSFQITTIVHSIDNSVIYHYPGKDITIAKALSNQLDKLINNPYYRSSVESPNGTESPLTEDIVPDMKLIKADLDQLIEDVQKEIYLTYFEKGNLIYS
ncbi:MAG: hypothetical protein A3D31_10035 [Candidatus Fluviicola riflensis]|nr:MAG: hypothetical protein CHH17_14450 [Candidatus Fluviicola riflensis]OGS77343.1 MAG: hypothetical protein A3D31_10035 [Candidatus Fluviicola riflensis]OGS83923.1 MAG: hypothetical protein A3E30_11435 [Fluviicola sp. RIFCSPHIGHO2_12_FULL_43_24]OGS84410.1 MAG: hypothetical protein A2724_06975 [Fluviicola sp. RIFCSPHIGHO2_01_FULL_43_53]